MALILQLLTDRGVSLREQLAQYPPFYITKEKVDLGGEFSPARISQLIEDLNPASIDMQDGVKAYFEDGWIHVRVSNTEGIVRVIAEAPTQAQSLEKQRVAQGILEASWAKK
jgi:phosphomannomutase